MDIANHFLDFATLEISPLVGAERVKAPTGAREAVQESARLARVRAPELRRLLDYYHAQQSAGVESRASMRSVRHELEGVAATIRRAETGRIEIRDGREVWVTPARPDRRTL